MRALSVEDEERGRARKRIMGRRDCETEDMVAAQAGMRFFIQI